MPPPPCAWLIGAQLEARRVEAQAAHLGVVAAEQAVVTGPHAGTLAVAVAAALCGAVAANEAKVAAAVVGLHA